MSHQDPDSLIPGRMPPPREHVRTRFDQRELVEVKGITFIVAEVGEGRLVLKPVDPRNWA